MPYFAAVFARTDQEWMGADADLTEVAGVDDVTDLMREVAVETAGDVVLLLIEENDEWFAVARLDGDDDLRVFLSDSRAMVNSDVAPLLYVDVEQTDAVPEGDPSGDFELLDDLGTDTGQLIELSERALPGDALSVVAERAGFQEEYDRLR